MNIPENRKSKIRLIIEDTNGNAICNETMHIDLQKHKFLFGCGAFDINNYMNTDDEEQKKFFEERTNKWLDVFNYATLPFYWGQFEPEEGQPHTEQLMRTAKFLKEKNVTVKGHPLCWHTECAPWLMKYDNPTIMEKQLQRIDREVAGFKGLIDMWDVINEVVIMPVFDKYDNAVTRLCNEYGQVGLVKRVFDEARKNNKDATLLINDFNTSPKYEDLLERILDAGVEVSAIGIQSHQHQGYWGKEKILDVLERFSRFGLPIYFTENTLVSGTAIPEYIVDLNDWQVDEWPSTPELEEVQKNNMKEMYTTLFECPQVEAITTWDFTDGAWLKAPSGFLRTDNSIKPSYVMMKELIHKELSTNEEIVTDSDGAVTVEGFKGEYIITYGEKTAKFTIDDGIDTVKIVF